jgi:hypothetical protein
MPYAIITTDKPDHLRVRNDNRPEHVDYLVANQHRLLAGGALIEDNGSGGKGGLIIVDTDDQSEAEAFINGDRFIKAGLFQSVTISRWRKAFLNFETLI